MVRRLHLEAGRLVLSRPGHAASPALDDAHKIIDSEWGYAGLLIASGVTQHQGGNGGVWDVVFPDVGYRPTVILLERQWEFTGGTPENAYVRAFRNLEAYNVEGSNRMYNIEVMSDRIRFSHIAGRNAFDYEIIYHVFGFA